MGRPTTEYDLTTEAAKAVAMLEGNAVGNAVRTHFIRCEGPPEHEAFVPA